MAFKPPKLVVPAEGVAITTDELIAQLRAEPEDYPAESAQRRALEQAINAATQWCESYTRTTIVLSEWVFAADAFDSAGMRIPLWPNLSVLSVEYTDPAGADQTLAPESYILDEYSVTPVLHPVDAWPATKDTPNAVRVAVQVGYENGNAVPASIKGALLMLAAHLVENASATAPVTMAEVPMGVKSLLEPYRVEWQ